MDIAEKKDEILQLISQLQTHRPSSRLAAQDLRQPQKEIVDRIADRRETLAQLKSRREKLGLDLLEERLLSICQSLETRISKIEELLNQGSPIGAAPQKKSNGTDLAQDLNSMLPDISTESKTTLGLPASAENKEEKDELSFSLGGKVEETTLPDILQLVSSNQKTGIFKLEDSSNVIDLYFREGHIYHAQGNELSGQNAFFAAMAMSTGRFRFIDTEKIPEEKTIDGNTQFMILEALRQIDEERGGS
jgi:hypothetical protein